VITLRDHLAASQAADFAIALLGIIAAGSLAGMASWMVTVTGIIGDGRIAGPGEKTISAPAADAARLPIPSCQSLRNRSSDVSMALEADIASRSRLASVCPRCTKWRKEREQESADSVRNSLNRFLAYSWIPLRR